MESINVKIVHPINGSDIDLGLPTNILLGDIFSQLVDAAYLPQEQPFVGILKPNRFSKESRALDNNTTIEENGVINNDTIFQSVD